MNERIKSWLFLLVILIVTTAIYKNHFQNGFHFDDSHTVQNNLYIQNIHNIPLFFRDGTTFSSLPSNQSYRPIVTTSLAIDYWLGGGLNNLFFFHLTTFILFLLQGCLMFALFRRIIAQSAATAYDLPISLFTVAWYLLHPVCAETVNYIIQRADLQSTFFVLLGLVLYIISPLCKRYYLFLIPVIIGCLAKPSAVMFAPIWLCYYILFEKQQSIPAFFSTLFKDFTSLLKVVLIPFVICAATYLFMRKMEPATWTPGGSSTFNYVITQPYIMLHYFVSLFLPTLLSADTDWTIFASPTNSKCIIGFFFLAGIIGVIFHTSLQKRLRPITFGLAWFLLALIPTSVVPLAEVMNDHRMFFPYVGLVLAVVWMGFILLEYYLNSIVFDSGKKTFIALGLILFVGLYAHATYQRNIVWHSEESLWKDVTEKSPNNGRGLMNYGLSLMGRGDYAGAETYFSRGLQLWPGYSYLYVNMGIVKNAMGKTAEAEGYFRKGVELGSSVPKNYFFYARFLNQIGKKEEAINNLKSCLSKTAADLNARNLLMEILAEQKRNEELRQIAQETLQIDPANVAAAQFLQIAAGKSQTDILKENADKNPTPEAYLNLSLSYYQAGKFEDCIHAAEEALKLKPNFPEALNNICSAYNSLGRFAEGAKACEQAIQLRPDYPLAKNNLAWAKSNLK